MRTSKIQRLLDDAGPQLAETARIWREGAKDDTAFHGDFIWTLYECQTGRCREGYEAAMEEWLEIFRRSGLDATAAKLPEGWPNES